MKSLIQTPTNQLKNSVEFYTKLNFVITHKENKTYATSKGATIEINEERFARAGVKLYKNDWSNDIETLKSETSVVKINGGHLLAAPSGCWVYLMNGDGPTINDQAANNDAVLGNYAGVSLESISMEHSISFWKYFGFEKTMGGLEHGWIALSDEEGFGISIMKPNVCKHLFFTPSLTYFNGGKNLPVIQKIRNLNIPITEEITIFNDEGEVDNVIIRDPGGLGFFVFND